MGGYTENTESILDIAKNLNLSMDLVALWCGIDACFAAARSTDDFVCVDPREEEYLCKDSARGIVMCFETKKRKHDHRND